MRGRQGINAIKLRIYTQIVIPTKACPHESGDGYDSRFPFSRE